MPERTREGTRDRGRCFPRPPRSEKGAPNGCWYKAALNRLGYYTPPADMGITDDLDDPVFRTALHAFQRQGSVYTGDTDIGPGTTTERLLIDALEQTDESGAYIWRTASDDKVRDEHSARAGKTYTWNAPPDGDHPGDDYNCRCWAEPLNPSQHPWAVWAREQADERRGNVVQKLAPPLSLKNDTILPQAERDETKPSAADIALTAAAVLIALRLGRKVPIATILKVIKGRKPLEAIRRKTVDRKIYKKPKGIPDNWVAKPLKKGIGVEYKDPINPHRLIRIEKGDPNSSFLGRRYDNIRWQIDGKSLDINGNIVPKKSMESHIPINDFKFNPEIFK